MRGQAAHGRFGCSPSPPRRVYGDAGNDRIAAGAGDDTAYGNEGEDVCTGDADDDAPGGC